MLAPENKRESLHFVRIRRSPHKHVGAARFDRAEIGSEIMFGGNGIDDEIERICQGFKIFRVFGDYEFLRAEPAGVLFFVGRSAKYRYLRSHGCRNLNGHMPQST